MKLFDYGAFPTDIKLFNLKESERTFLRTSYKCDQTVAPYSRLILRISRVASLLHLMHKLHTKYFQMFDRAFVDMR